MLKTCFVHKSVTQISFIQLLQIENPVAFNTIPIHEHLLAIEVLLTLNTRLFSLKKINRWWQQQLKKRKPSS